ncbi:MAG: hypothetical protein ACJA13_000370 [Paraglaciecola sp.]|jgi:hypothetical protein
MTALCNMEIDQRDDHLVDDRSSGAADKRQQAQKSRDPEQGANFL